jgi:polypyrimidine tract-binding protein 2
MLHVSNILSPTTEEELRALFGKYGTVVNFQFFAYAKNVIYHTDHFVSNDTRMCLVEMSSPQEATEALVFMHNYRIGDSNIRVSFSSSKIK